MLVTLIAIKISGGVIVSHFTQSYRPAIRVAFNQGSDFLVTQSVWILVISTVAAIIIWVSGRYKPSTSIRKKTMSLISGHVK
jgi:hypothetical protein